MRGANRGAEVWLRIIVARRHALRDADGLWAYILRSPVC
jgi:hypothetical protein